MELSKLVGNTPLVNLNLDTVVPINFYAKLEYYNPTGSVKDRAANYLIKKLLRLGAIKKGHVLIESSSGNFGVALAAFSREYELDFYCVTDPNVSSANEMLIQAWSTKLIKVETPDAFGGYLINRISKVKDLLAKTKNSYWVNQYANPYNAEAYYHTLGYEICEQMESIDYVFICVSSGGTITGVSQRVKEAYPNAKVIAVDIEGSVVFGGSPSKRNIPGIGSSIVPEILKQSKIDEVVMIDEYSTIRMCQELLEKYAIFAGGSSGLVYAAVKKYFEGCRSPVVTPNVVAIFPDRGDRYCDTIYNSVWRDKVHENLTVRSVNARIF